MVVSTFKTMSLFLTLLNDVHVGTKGIVLRRFGAC